MIIAKIESTLSELHEILYWRSANISENGRLVVSLESDIINPFGSVCIF